MVSKRLLVIVVVFIALTLVIKFRDKGYGFYKNNQFKNLDIKVIDESGNTVLMNAVHRGDLFLIKYILNENLKIDINHVNKYGETALYIATNPRYNIKYGDKKKYRDEIIRILLKNNADPNILTSRKNAPIFNVTGKEDFESFKLLVKHGAKINSLDSKGNNVSHYAVINNNASILKFLLDQNMNVNIVTKSNDNALHMASGRYNYKTVDFLLMSGADVNSRNHSGDTPLMVALLSEGIRHSANDGVFFEKSFIKSLIKTVDILIESGACIECEGSEGSPQTIAYMHYCSRYINFKKKFSSLCNL